MKKEAAQALYGPLQGKSLETHLAHFVREQFPHLGGPAVVELFVSHAVKVCEAFFRPSGALRMGQFVWWAPAADQKGGGKKMEDTALVPVVLTLITPEELDLLATGTSPRELRPQVVARWLNEAKNQGGILSSSDVSAFWCVSASSVNTWVRTYERQHHVTLPTAGAVFDLGTKTTHKRQVVAEHLKKKMTPSIASKVHHSPGATDRYIRDFERIKLCLQKGLTVQEASQATGIGLHVAKEYQELAHEHYPELFTPDSPQQKGGKHPNPSKPLPARPEDRALLRSNPSAGRAAVRREPRSGSSPSRGTTGRGSPLPSRRQPQCDKPKTP